MLKNDVEQPIEEPFHLQSLLNNKRAKKPKNERRQRFDQIVRADHQYRYGKEAKLPAVSKDNPIKARLSCKYYPEFFGYKRGTDVSIIGAYKTGSRVHLTINIEGDDRNLGCEVYDVMSY